MCTYIRQDIAEIQLKLALNSKPSIDQPMQIHVIYITTQYENWLKKKYVPYNNILSKKGLGVVFGVYLHFQ